MRPFVLALTAALFVGACSGVDGSASDVGATDAGATVAGSDAGTTDAATEAADTCPVDAGLDEVPPLHPSVDSYQQVQIALVSPPEDCRVDLAVRHADTGALRAHGLMEVPSLPDGTGMLFTYPDVEGARTGGYYMKNTLVPLDIAYLAADGTIQDILRMTPCDADPCPTYPPDHPYRATLEVAAGWFARIGVTVGWKVVLPTG